MSYVTKDEELHPASKFTNREFFIGKSEQEHMGQNLSDEGKKGGRWEGSTGPPKPLGRRAARVWVAQRGTWGDCVKGSRKQLLSCHPLTCPKTNLHMKKLNCCGRGGGNGDQSQGHPPCLYSQAHLKHPVFATDHKHLNPSLHLVLSKYQNRRHLQICSSKNSTRFPWHSLKWEEGQMQTAIATGGGRGHEYKVGACVHREDEAVHPHSAIWPAVVTTA